MQLKNIITKISQEPQGAICNTNNTHITIANVNTTEDADATDNNNNYNYINQTSFICNNSVINKNSIFGGGLLRILQDYNIIENGVCYFTTIQKDILSAERAKISQNNEIMKSSNNNNHIDIIKISNAGEGVDLSGINTTNLHHLIVHI